MDPGDISLRNIYPSLTKFVMLMLLVNMAIQQGFCNFVHKLVSIFINLKMSFMVKTNLTWTQLLAPHLSVLPSFHPGQWGALTCKGKYFHNLHFMGNLLGNLQPQGQVQGEPCSIVVSILKFTLYAIFDQH